MSSEKFEAIAYKRGDDGVFREYSRATGSSGADAARRVAGRLPLGYGGHKRSQRVADSIARGVTESTPLGVYRVVVVSCGYCGRAECDASCRPSWADDSTVS